LGVILTNDRYRFSGQTEFLEELLFREEGSVLNRKVKESNMVVIPDYSREERPLIFTSLKDPLAEYPAPNEYPKNSAPLEDATYIFAYKPGRWKGVWPLGARALYTNGGSIRDKPTIIWLMSDETHPIDLTSLYQSFPHNVSWVLSLGGKNKSPDIYFPGWLQLVGKAAEMTEEDLFAFDPSIPSIRRYLSTPEEPRPRRKYLVKDDLFGRPLYPLEIHRCSTCAEFKEDCELLALDPLSSDSRSFWHSRLRLCDPEKRCKATKGICHCSQGQGEELVRGSYSSVSCGR
jgi:hypothetical protein